MSARRIAAALIGAAALLPLAGCGEPPPCPLCPAIGQRDPPAVQALLDRGEPVTREALEDAIEPRRLDQRTQFRIEPRDRRIAELLIARGNVHARWHVSTTSGGTGTSSVRGSGFQRHLAAAVMVNWPDPAMVALLLQRGLDAKGEAGGEALRAAVVAGGRDAVRAWIAAGAPVNHVGTEGSFGRTTALAEAIQRRDLAMIADLEAAGALEWPD